MLLHNAYETTVYRGLNTQPISQAIELSLAMNDLRVDEETDLVLIEQDTGTVADIKSFEQPLLVSYKNETYVAVDLRFFVRPVSRQDPGQGVVIRSPNEHSLILTAALLTKRWSQGEQRELLSTHSSIQTSYANWISKALTSRFQLDVIEQRYVRVLAAYFFAGQFFENEQLSERDMNAMVAMIARNLKIQASEVFAMVEHLPVIKDMEDFVRVLIEQTQSKRLMRLTTGVLATVLSAGWFGTNAKHLVIAALEYPPNWLALVRTALSYNVYKRTLIGSTVLAVAGNNKDAVIRAIDNAVKY